MKKLLSLLLTALMLAGILSVTVIPAFALPSPDQSKNFDAAVSVNGDQMSIAGYGANNMTTWESFDVREDEVVQFTDNSDYLILVRGEDPSCINGTLQGGGKIYIINPNGVIFGSNSTVNVGNLYVSANPSVPGSGSVLSVGYPWIVVTIAVAAVFGLGGFLLGRRKKSAPASGTESEDGE